MSASVHPLFRYDGYREFLEALKGLGKTELFRDWRKGSKVFLLRHDVDFSVELAHRLAVIEAEHGIKSTYFILTTCETYNVLCSRERKLLREMAAMGHEIGLHFDPSLYPGEERGAFEREIGILSFALQGEVQSVSLHNPSVHGQYPMFDGYVNAYHPDLFSDANYISDSRMSFRGKDPYAWIEGIRQGTVQILLHPMHYSAEGGGYGQIVFGELLRHVERVHGTFTVNSAYAEATGADWLSAFKRHLP